jgi:hypothetical protein
MSPELQPQDIERVIRPHGDLLPLPRCTDRQQPSTYAHIGYQTPLTYFLSMKVAMQVTYSIRMGPNTMCWPCSFERAEDVIRGFPFPDDFDAFGDMHAYMGALGTSTPDISR